MLSQSELAREWQCSQSNVSRLVRQGMPLTSRADAEKWKQDHQRRRGRTGGPKIEVDARKLTNEQLEHPGDLAHAQLFQRILVCRKLAHEITEARKRVIPRAEVIAGQKRVDNAVKTLLLGLPGVCGELVGQPEHGIQRKLSTWVHATLSTLSDPHNPVYQA